MSRKTLIFVMAVLMIAAVFAGCKKEPAESGDVVKTVAEYETQAENEITTDNMEDELEKMEKAVSTELETDME